MRETIRFIEVRENMAIYEDSDMDGIYKYDEDGKIVGLKGEGKIYYSEPITPKKKEEEKQKSNLAEVIDPLKTALKALRIGKKHVTIKRNDSWSYLVYINGEYFGIWDITKLNFVA